MKFTHLLAAICCAMSLISCGEEKQSDLFDYSKPVDLSTILQAYDWYQNYEGENKDSILYTKIGLELPEDEFYLFEDTAFVLRVPEYEDSKQPFLPMLRTSLTVAPCHGMYGATMRYGTEVTRQTRYATMMKSREASRPSVSISSKIRMCVSQHRISRTRFSN